MAEYRIRSMDTGELNVFFARIERDFAPGEYAPYEVLRAQIRSGAQEGLVFGDDRTDVAYAICAVNRGIGYVLVSLFAVFDEYRGRGAGTMFMEKIHSRYSGMRGVIVEVEKPEDAETPEERDQRMRRISFYRKLGYLQVPGIDYSIWDVSMHLMVLPLGASAGEIFSGIGEAMRGIYLGLMGKKFIHKLKLKTVG